MAESKQKHLTKEEILARRGKRKTEFVPLEDGGVLVSAMSSFARDEFEQSLMVETTDEKGKPKMKRDRKNFRAKLLAATLVDENGAAMFTEEEVVAIGQIDAAFWEPAVNVALRLNGFSDDDIEAIAKNSDGGHTDDS